MHLLKIKKKKKKGFTLIEMVIVITLLGIISSIAVGKYSKVQENAKLNADYATAANLATAASLAINDDVIVKDVNSLASAGYIQFVPEPKSKKGESFSLEINGDSVIVKVGDDTFYPRLDNKTQ